MPPVKNLPFGKNQDVLIEPRKILSQKSLENVLQQCGLKVTRQRMAVLRALNTGPRAHMTAQDILEEARKACPQTGFATIYRFLKCLIRSGQVTVISIGQAGARYELKSKEFHYHITCVNCGKIIEFKDKTIENRVNRLMRSRNYILKRQAIELYVRCDSAACKKRKAAGSKSKTA